MFKNYSLSEFQLHHVVLTTATMLSFRGPELILQYNLSPLAAWHPPANGHSSSWGFPLCCCWCSLSLLAINPHHTISYGLLMFCTPSRLSPQSIDCFFWCAETSYYGVSFFSPLTIDFGCLCILESCPKLIVIQIYNMDLAFCFSSGFTGSVHIFESLVCFSLHFYKI